MLKSTRAGFLSPFRYENRAEKQDERVSFGSLSKHKRKNIFMSEVNRVEPNSQKPSLLYSQYRQNDINKQNVKQQYRLFTNTIKEKVERKVEKLNSPQPISSPVNQYWNFQVKRNNFGSQKTVKRVQRVNSKQKVEKMFEVPKKLIREKDRKQKERVLCKIDDSVILKGPHMGESVQNEMDFVNTSEASAQFDMSPYLY